MQDVAIEIPGPSNLNINRQLNHEPNPGDVALESNEDLISNSERASGRSDHLESSRSEQNFAN